MVSERSSASKRCVSAATRRSTSGWIEPSCAEPSPGNSSFAPRGIPAVCDSPTVASDTARPWRTISATVEYILPVEWFDKDVDGAAAGKPYIGDHVGGDAVAYHL